MTNILISDEYNMYTIEFPNNEHINISRQKLEKFFRIREWNFKAVEHRKRPGVFRVSLDEDDYTQLRNLCNLSGGYRRSLVKKTSRKFKKSSRRNNYV